jgi:membrane protein DedA with SNARE-associated domain
MLNFLDGHSAYVIYIFLFFLLLLCGVGFPMAEELVLLAGGMLVASAVLNPALMFLVTFLGVMLGDVLLFGFGHGLATRFTHSAYFTRWFSPQRLARGQAFFVRHGSATVFLARFIPGLRAPTFLLAGTMRMGFWRFVVMDTLAALVFIPVICVVGYWFADQIDVVATWFRKVERVILTLVGLAGLSWCIKRYRSKKAEPIATPHVRAVDQP